MKAKGRLASRRLIALGGWLAFLRTNRAMYARIVANKRFGPGVRLFVEEGKIRARGKTVSIVAMMSCATLGALAIPPPWVKVIVVAAAAAGSAWVACLPTPESAARRTEAAEAADRAPAAGRGGCA